MLNSIEGQLFEHANTKNPIVACANQIISWPHLISNYGVQFSAPLGPMCSDNWLPTVLFKFVLLVKKQLLGNPK